MATRLHTHCVLTGCLDAWPDAASGMQRVGRDSLSAVWPVPHNPNPTHVAASFMDAAPVVFSLTSHRLNNAS